VQDLITVAQSWLPDEAIKLLMAIGVILAGVVYGRRAFATGAQSSGPVKSTPESDLRQGITALAAESRRMHGETHDKLDDIEGRIESLEKVGAVLLDRSARHGRD